MTLHQGKTYTSDRVSLETPVPEMIRSAPQAEDIRGSVAHWLAEALKEETVYYFAISESGRLVGQVLLHDINPKNKSSLVAYHLFDPANRGRGIGTEMLKLLQRFISEETSIEKLFIITSRDNLASQGIAQKCGFTYVGASREDPIEGMIFEWRKT